MPQGDRKNVPYIRKHELWLSLAVFLLLSSLYLFKWCNDLSLDFSMLYQSHRQVHHLTREGVEGLVGERTQLVDGEVDEVRISKLLERFPSARHFLFDRDGRILFRSDGAEKVAVQLRQEPWIWSGISEENLLLVRSFQFYRPEIVNFSNLLLDRPDYLASKTVNPVSGLLTITVTPLGALTSHSLQALGTWLLALVVGLFSIPFGLALLRLALARRKKTFIAPPPPSRERIFQNIIRQRALPLPSKVPGLPVNLGKAYIRIRGVDRDEWQEIGEGPDVKGSFRVESVRDLSKC